MSPSTPARALCVLALICLTLVVPSSAGALVASDPYAVESWQLDGDGPMGVNTAWDQTTGAGVVVAIIDTGIDLSHPDLRDNLWNNPGEIADNGVDDDRDGFVDDVHGADLVNHDGTPQDDNGHGTHVAGIIGARGGNGIGTAGVAWRVRLMAVKALDANAAGNALTVADGLRYAVDHGARIVNLSLAGPGRSDDLESAIRYAGDHGVLVVCAAGNDGNDLALVPSYPASLPEANVLGVAATDEGGLLSAISSFGPGVDLSAPGEGILSTARGGGYELRTGTSMAAPMVAGAAALVASALPGADSSALTGALAGGARRSVLPVGAGALDVAGALRRVIPAAAWRGSLPDGTDTGRGSSTAPVISASERAAHRRARVVRSARARASVKKVRKRTGVHVRARTRSSAGVPMFYGT